ncbi:MAG TPA: TetR/AcrR family transcriptional regulator [Iamia sp.]|nr:TetR/AcrR family transcriptional regulator [Iamia sp.]
MPADQDQIDGRTARRDRNREAVLDAVLDLFREDAMTPTPAQVAARSGVSTRSVQRYFEDMDSLVRAAMAHHLERVGPLFEIPGLGLGPLAERVERMVTNRLRLYAEVAPLVRAAMLRIRSNPLIRARLATARAQMRAQTAAMFAPELDALAPDAGRDVLDAVDALLAFDALELLRVGLDRSEADATRVLTGALGALLGPSAPPP